MTPLKAIDYPPVWLAAFLGVSWVVGRLVPMASMPVTGLGLAGLGAALMLTALAQMVWARTTFVPRKSPAKLVTRGVFAQTRNPIYVGDALILAGLSLYWHAILALPLVAIFVMTINRRFIKGEETVLRQAFGAEFADYCARTRRWL